jgi:lipopolysaccharide export system permease protein
MTAAILLPRAKRRYFSATLFWYLARQYVATIFATTMALTTVLLAAETIETLRRVSGKGVGNPDIVKLIFFKMPDMLLQLAPFAIMLGTLFCLFRLTRNNELAAVRASGVSAWQFLLPPMAMCLIIGFFNMLVLNPFAASTLKRYERLNADIFPGSARGLVVEGGAIWLKQDEPMADVIIYADKVRDQGQRLENVTVFKFTKDGAFINLMAATSMTLEEGQQGDRVSDWVLSDVKTLSTLEPVQREAEVRLPTSMTLEKLRSSFTSPNTLSVWQLPDFIETLRETGFPTALHELHWQRILSMPAMALAMFLLAAPFPLRLSRRGGIGKLLLIGLCSGFGFYLFSNIIGAYGLSGRLAIPLAAWTPTLIAALIGIALLLHFGEE